MINHYELSENKKLIDGIEFTQLRLKKDTHFGNNGDLHGWVEKLENVSDDARVSGDARVYGDARVSGNAWVSSPFQLQGSMHFVNECKKGFLKIGCHEYDFNYWVENFERIGRENNYNQKQINEYKLYIDLAISLSKL